MSDATKAYLVALGLTLASELPVVWGFFRGRVTPAWRLPAVFLMTNLVTHGLLWTVWSHLPGSYVPRLVGAETAVVVAEAASFWGLLGGSWRRAALASLAANTLSVLVGLAVRQLGV